MATAQTPNVEDKMSATLLKEIPVFSYGKHESINDGCCIMEAVSFVAGEPWSDHPQCACPVIGALLRSWNDNLPDDQRDTLLRPLTLKLVGTRATTEIEKRRAVMAADWYIRVFTPAWLRFAGLADQASALASLPEITDFMQCPSLMPAIEGAREASSAAWSAASSAARSAARSAAEAAASAAASSVAEAAASSAARSAARSAASSAAEAAVSSVAWWAARSAAEAAASSAARSAAWWAARSAARSAASAAAEAAVSSVAWWAARSAAEAAASAALQQTVIELQTSALDLVERMIAVQQ